jgi:hypothetical protein
MTAALDPQFQTLLRQSVEPTLRRCLSTDTFAPEPVVRPASIEMSQADRTDRVGPPRRSICWWSCVVLSTQPILYHIVSHRSALMPIPWQRCISASSSRSHHPRCCFVTRCTITRAPAIRGSGARSQRAVSARGAARRAAERGARSSRALLFAPAISLRCRNDGPFSRS